MRPSGGYKNIPYVTVPVKFYMTGFQMFTGYGAVTSIGLYIYYLNAKMIQGEYIEIRLAQNSLFPVLIAERDLISKLGNWQARTATNCNNTNIGEKTSLYSKPVCPVNFRQIRPSHLTSSESLNILNNVERNV
uniref:NADH dehydrogenase [ubiquinone] 1 alpha subcomplex subunit 13 n=1 Tax=Glossina pallidipes TaxID=7398 RepID=A0A1B0A7B1_GLOPL